MPLLVASAALLLVLSRTCTGQLPVLMNMQISAISELDEVKGTFVLDSKLNMYTQLPMSSLGNKTELVFNSPTIPVEYAPNEATIARFEVEFQNSVGPKKAIYGPAYKVATQVPRASIQPIPSILPFRG